MMKRIHSKIIAFALALFAVASTNADGVSSDSGNRRDSKADVTTSAEQQRKTSLRLPVLTVRRRPSSGKMVGNCSFLPMGVLVSGGQTPLRISFSDDTPNGSGKTIRNSLWTAALVAALQKESALQGVRISLDFKGDVDGPSAGAVMCLGIMSALDGREFPDDFAMTGTILPDGTVGRVGGVPEKLKAAAKNPKIKRVAIPAFQRFERDADGIWIDLFELGRELGLELCPVESIGDAYCFLYREKISRPVMPTALSVIRESAAFEANAAEIFKSRYDALRGRLDDLSSNEWNTVSQGFEWKSINPEEAERRFEEGAIFDALELIARSDACLTAVLESQKSYRDYEDRFLNKVDGKRKLFKKPLRDTKMHEWPIETQLAFIDGFRKEISDFCETALGWKNIDDDSSEDEKTGPDEPWFGLAPAVGASDLDAQLLSLVETAKAEGQYRYMVKQTFNRTNLKKALQDGDRNIYSEIDYDRKKLFFLMSTKYRDSSFQGVSIPPLNAGQEVSSALELFRKAWVIVDGMIESDVVDSWANSAAVHKNDVHEYLIGQDPQFAVYDAAKRRGEVLFALYDDAINDDKPFGYQSYTDSSLLFICADLFAEANAQELSLDGELSNVSFTAFVTDRARISALLGMEACRKAGIPCFGAVLSFQKAERGRAERSETVTQILADYWKATMSAKALLMAFKNGKGPKQGFSGYKLSDEAAAAAKSEEAIFQAVLNAELVPLIQSLPETWLKGLSDSAAVFAEKASDEVWSAAREAIEQLGRLLVGKSELFADMLATDVLEGIDKSVAQGVVVNWGERLIGISKSATREAVANGRLMDVLMAQVAKDNPSAGKMFPMPKIKAKQKKRNTVQVSVSDWSNISTTLELALGSGPDLFQKVDGKMVIADMISVFKDCASWKSLVAKEMSETKDEDQKSTIAEIKLISEAIKKANDSTDIDSLKAAFECIERLLSQDEPAGEDATNPHQTQSRDGNGDADAVSKSAPVDSSASDSDDEDDEFDF